MKHMRGFRLVREIDGKILLVDYTNDCNGEPLGVFNSRDQALRHIEKILGMVS